MEANSKPMYQPWNEEVFQADVFVRGMTWLQRHLYRALLQASFFHSTRPYLPNDDEVLWVLAGAESLEMWTENKVRVLKRFSVCSHDANLLENRRVTADWERLMDVRKKMSELGQRSAAVQRTFNGGSTVVQRPGSPRVLVADGGATREVEVEREQGELSSEKESAPTDSSSIQESKPLGGDWKSLAVRHKRVFNKKASVSFKDKYADACAKYGEDVVLQYFDEWAPGARSWVLEKNIDQPLNLFFKKLPEEAADAVVLAAAIADEDKKAEETKQRYAEDKARQEEAQRVSIARQTEEIVARRDNRPVQNEESVLDFLSGMGETNVTTASGDAAGERPASRDV